MSEVEKQDKYKGRPDAIDRLIGKNLEQARLLRGIPLQELADALEVSVAQMQKYEKGTNRISGGKLKPLADTLNLPISYFYKERSECPDSALEAAEVLKEVVKQNTVTLLKKNFLAIEDKSLQRICSSLVRRIAKISRVKQKKEKKDE